MNKNTNLLWLCYKTWLSAADLRERRNRYKRYTYGEQWGDLVDDGTGHYIPEGELASRMGKKPLTNNLIRQLVKSVVGRFRNAAAQSPKDESTVPISAANQLDELDSRLLEEFLISGCAIQRVGNEMRRQGNGVWVDNVNPRHFFVNTLTDPRAWDIELIGMIHDLSYQELLMRFANGSRHRAQMLRQIYSADINSSISSLASSLGASLTDSLEFFRASPGKCRVIEVWTLESRERLRCHDPESASYYIVTADRQTALDKENKRRQKEGRSMIESRWELVAHWHCRYMTPTGEVIHEGDSPYGHRQHPFVVKFYPLTDGEIHSFVEDVIDQQRYVNRLITLIDHIMGASAKGVLLFPEDQLPASMTWEHIVNNWSACNGVIPYEPKAGLPGPQQVTSKGTDIGAYELLSLEMKLMEDVSGVNGALQGKTASAMTSATLYETQIKNATIALTDLYETFASFRRQRDSKIKGSRGRVPRCAAMVEERES
ncbi:MAG: hypothetical protein IJY31_07210 [Muribaculaceae bacterium]|nr:hypothetical protein [Muribaculaceae bacterium]